MQVHLVDGTYELFRHHFAVPSHLDDDGIEVAAVRGVLGSVLGMLEQGATHVGVATDHVIESFRNDLWAGYKTSAGMPPELLAQFPMLEDALRALGVAVWPMVDLEADDALASAAAVARADPRVERVSICTPDKDLAQCVEDPIVVQVDRRLRARTADDQDGKVIDEAGVRERFGVSPGSIPDYLALVGDSADGFPGLPGWGAKSAATVLARYEHLAAIPDDAGAWDVSVRGAAKLAATLATAREAAELFLDLATLRTGADVGSVDEWEWIGPRPSSWSGRRVSMRRISSGARTDSPNVGVEVESLELVVGDHVFSARAAGPTDGDLVLLLHGFPQTSLEWRAQLAALAAAGYRAVAPDQRGCSPGARPDAVDAYRVDELVRDVVGFADVLGADRFHLVGHDWGGALAWFTAGSLGERIRTLTVVSTPHPVPFSESIRNGEQREKSSYMLVFRTPAAEAMFLDDDARLLRDLFSDAGIDDAYRDEYVRVLRAGALTGGLNWYRANTFAEPIGPITVPTLYVWSDDDVAIGREAAEGTAAHVDGPYRFEVLAGVSHWIPEAAPDRLNSLLLEHLRTG